MDDGGSSACARRATRWRRLEPFDAEGVEAALRAVVDELGVKPKDVFQPVRVAISGTTVSPGIFESVAALGRDETLASARNRSAERRASP